MNLEMTKKTIYTKIFKKNHFMNFTKIELGTI